MNVRNIHHCPTLLFCTGDNGRFVLDRGLRVGVGSVFVTEVFGCLLQLALVSVPDRFRWVGDTARLGRRIHWGDEVGSRLGRGAALGCGIRLCATGDIALLLRRSVGEVFVDFLSR